MKKPLYIGIGVFSEKNGRIYRSFAIPKTVTNIAELDTFISHEWVELGKEFNTIPFSVDILQLEKGKKKGFPLGISRTYFAGKYEQNKVFELINGIPKLLNRDEVSKLLLA